MVLPHVGHGGDWVAISSLSAALRSVGHEVWLASTLPPSAEFDGILPLRIHGGGSDWIWSLMQIKMVPADFDVIHAHSPRALLFSFLLRHFRCRRSAVVATWHWQTDTGRIRGRLRNYLFAASDGLHVPSELTSAVLSSERCRNVVIPHGVDVRKWPLRTEAEQQLSREKLDLSNESTIIVFAGRLDKGKNVDLILSVFEKFSAEAKTIGLKALICGDGPGKSALVRRSEMGWYKDRVIFTGHLSDIRPTLAAADLLVLPSSAETFSIVNLEAALTGIPCLRSATGGASEQIADGITGATCPVGDEKAFHAKLLELASNRRRLFDMGKAARARATQFDIARLIERYLSFYEAAMKFRGLESDTRSAFEKGVSRGGLA